MTANPIQVDRFSRRLPGEGHRLRRRASTSLASGLSTFDAASGIGPRPCSFPCRAFPINA